MTVLIGNLYCCIYEFYQWVMVFLHDDLLVNLLVKTVDDIDEIIMDVNIESLS